MWLRSDSRILRKRRSVEFILLGAISIFYIHSVPATAKHKVPQESSQQERQFAFWYEDWKPDTWDKLQPANVLIGVPEKAVAEIHGKGGSALHYVTFYQAKFGTVFLKNQDDLAAVGFHTPQGYLPSAFGGENNYVLCSNSQELRNRALAYVDQIVRTNKFDGLFVDNTYLPPATTQVCDAKHAHVTPGENGGSAYVDLLGAVYSAVKKINPTALIIINPGNPARFTLQSHGHTAWDFSDYLLWESYGYASVVGPGHDRWKQTIEASFDLAKSPNAQKVLALSYPKTEAEALYSYAVASTFGFRYSANLGVSEQGKEGTGGHYGVFAPKLPHLIGSPTNALPAAGTTVLRREYKNGVCIVNLGQSDYAVVADRSVTLYAESGSSKLKKGQRYSLPPGKSAILIY
jgi:hypothetical protein